MPKIPGFRNAVVALRTIAELIERNPDFPEPTVTLHPGLETSNTVHFSISHYSYDYLLPSEERERQRQRIIEEKILTVMDALGQDVQWMTNDPSSGEYFDKTYYQLQGLWMGLRVSISCPRDQVGEFVTVVDSGPQVLHDADGQVQAVRQSVTIWKPNINLSRRSVPAYELEAQPLALAIEGSVVDS